VQVIVCGARTIGQVAPDLSGKSAAKEMNRASAERKFIIGHLSRLHGETPITMVIAGEEGGVGSIALNWARVNKVPTSVWRRLKFPKSALLNSLASLRKKERAADYTMETFEARNIRVLAGSQPELVISFGGGESTKVLVDAAKEKGLKVVEIEIPDFTQVSV
jgi:hypothetical protein